MTPRWFDLPAQDWVQLNANLRRLTSEVNTELAAVGGLPVGGTTGQVLTKQSATDGDADWQDVPTPPAPVVPIVVPIHADATANVTLTNQASAEQFLANNNRNIWRLDLSGATDVRLVARVVTGSASANTPRLRVRYATTFTTTVASYADIGTSEVACSLALTNLIDSGWVALAAGAKIDPCYVAVTQLGGDGVADPALGNIQLWIR